MATYPRRLARTIWIIHHELLPCMYRQGGKKLWVQVKQMYLIMVVASLMFLHLHQGVGCILTWNIYGKFSCRLTEGPCKDSFRFWNKQHNLAQKGICNASALCYFASKSVKEFRCKKQLKYKCNTKHVFLWKNYCTSLCRYYDLPFPPLPPLPGHPVYQTQQWHAQKKAQGTANSIQHIVQVIQKMLLCMDYL